MAGDGTSEMVTSASARIRSFRLFFTLTALSLLTPDSLMSKARVLAMVEIDQTCVIWVKLQLILFQQLQDLVVNGMWLLRSSFEEKIYIYYHTSMLLNL